jgi:hypothetical protein
MQEPFPNVDLPEGWLDDNISDSMLTDDEEKGVGDDGDGNNKHAKKKGKSNG